MNITWTNGRDPMGAIRKRYQARSFASVIDVGPGIRPQTVVKAVVTQMWEPHGTYVDRLRQDYPRAFESQAYRVDQVDWAQGLTELEARLNEGEPKPDLLIALDVIEHLDKDAGLECLLRSMALVDHVLLYTPYGFHPQEQIGHAKDPWGLDGMVWQEHRCGWIPEDLPRGGEWEILALRKSHRLRYRGHQKIGMKPMDSFFAEWRKK